jgi:hypothetical protein
VPTWSRAPGALATGSPRATPAWDGALADGPVVGRQRQGVAGEHVGTTGRASDNESGGGAHRG